MKTYQQPSICVISVESAPLLGLSNRSPITPGIKRSRRQGSQWDEEDEEEYANEEY